MIFHKAVFFMFNHCQDVYNGEKFSVAPYIMANLMSSYNLYTIYFLCYILFVLGMSVIYTSYMCFFIICYTIMNIYKYIFNKYLNNNILIKII